MKYVVAVLALIVIMAIYGLLSALVFGGPNYILLAVFGALGGILFRMILTNWNRWTKK